MAEEQHYNRHGRPRNDPATEAWTSAANCELYINDPGPSRLNTGTTGEPRWTYRGEAWKEFYTTDLLATLDASPKLLREAIEELSSDLRGAYANDTARILGIELAERALTLIAEAGGLDDLRARARLLIASEHAQQNEVLGFVIPPEVRARDAAELAARLGVVPSRVVDAGDGWVAAERGVAAVMVVGV